MILVDSKELNALGDANVEIVKSMAHMELDTFEATRDHRNRKKEYMRCEVLLNLNVSSICIASEKSLICLWRRYFCLSELLLKTFGQL